METEDITTKRVNQGANIRKIRQMVGMKQDVLAKELGITQQSISSIEQKREIDKETLIKIATILKVSPKIIEEMDDSPISVVIENNFENGSHNYESGIGYVNELNDNKIVHPIEKILELSKENTTLYERMITIEKEKVALLEQLLNARE